MAELIVWIQANWMPVLVALLAIDQILVGIFPQVALLGSLKDILSALVGGNKPQLK